MPISGVQGVWQALWAVPGHAIFCSNITHRPADVESRFSTAGSADRKFYFQCLLALPKLWEAGATELRSDQPQGYYLLHVRGEVVPDGLGANEYKSRLSKKRGSAILEIVDHARAHEDSDDDEILCAQLEPLPGLGVGPEEPHPMGGALVVAADALPRGEPPALGAELDLFLAPSSEDGEPLIVPAGAACEPDVLERPEKSSSSPSSSSSSSETSQGSGDVQEVLVNVDDLRDLYPK